MASTAVAAIDETAFSASTSQQREDVQLTLARAQRLADTHHVTFVAPESASTVSVLRSGPVGSLTDRIREAQASGSEVEHRIGTEPEAAEPNLWFLSAEENARLITQPSTAVSRFELLQEFEGTVLEVLPSGFAARLIDRTDVDRPPERAEFELADVSESDRDLVAPGAVFYLSIGYRVHPWGQRERATALVFRRLPAWTRRDLQRSRLRAERWLAALAEDESR